MKILYFTRAYATHDYRFLSAMTEFGHEVYYLPLEHSGQILENRALPECVIKLDPLAGKSSAIWKDYPGLTHLLQKYLDKIKPDLVHAGPVQRIASLVASAKFHPLISMSWGMDLLKDAEESSWQHWLAEFTLQRTDLLLGDCRAVQDKAAEMGFTRGNVVLFPWGIDLTRFKPGLNKNLRALLGWEDAFVVLSLRSWEPVYGVDLTVKAFALASAQCPKMRLLLLGSGSQAKHIEHLIHESGVGHLVHLAGRIGQEQLPPYYQASDLYFSASHSDGSSVSLMEALGSGLPVLVSDIAGNREWIFPGEQGWLFPDGDVKAAAEGLRVAYQSRTHHIQIAAKSRKRAEEKADWRVNKLVLQRAYERVVKGIK